MLDVPCQHVYSGWNLGEPRLQAFVAALHVLENARRRGTGHVEELLEQSFPEGGLVVERPDTLIVAVEVRSHLIGGAVQQRVEPADCEKPIPCVHGECIHGRGPRAERIQVRLRVDSLTNEHHPTVEALEMLRQFLMKLPEGEAKMPSDLVAAQGLLD